MPMADRPKSTAARDRCFPFGERIESQFPCKVDVPMARSSQYRHHGFLPLGDMNRAPTDGLAFGFLLTLLVEHFNSP